MLPLSTHWCPQMGFYTIWVTTDGRDLLSRDNPLMPGPASCVRCWSQCSWLSGFSGSHISRDMLCYGKILVLSLGNNFQPDQQSTTKCLTLQLLGLTLTALHIRTIEKGVFGAQIWDLHPATLQRVCGFKGLQHRDCCITAKNLSLGVFASANLGFAALSL